MALIDGMIWSVVVFIIGVGLFLTAQIVSINNGELIITNSLKQTIKDCHVSDYYYVDMHRTICDKIGVTP